MSTITTRAGKGSVLTYTEVDANFTNLNTDKIQATNSPGTSGQVLTSDGTNATWSTPAAGGSNTVILYMTSLTFASTADSITTSSWTLLSSGGISGVSSTSTSVTLPAGSYMFEFPIMRGPSGGNEPAFIIKNTTAGTTLGTIDNLTNGSVSLNGTTYAVAWSPKYQFTLGSSSTISLYKSGSFPGSSQSYVDIRGGILFFKITKA
ncbi:hypothetical protein UFOVP645_37 [uncultured Caudovirales phage]|uniref:Uncharacterized protein n=1 Tax=uncultured Caudovirales phage TaxID=2100421 RepID=A0A6J5NBM9_9CAUD|nr:hypothetical protein UFOVP645_37 [uncultured Caudovirales phage]